LFSTQAPADAGQPQAWENAIFLRIRQINSKSAPPVAKNPQKRSGFLARAWLFLIEFADHKNGVFPSA